jgi:hypothetical protein
VAGIRGVLRAGEGGVNGITVPEKKRGVKGEHKSRCAGNSSVSKPKIPTFAMYFRDLICAPGKESNSLPGVERDH